MTVDQQRHYRGLSGLKPSPTQPQRCYTCARDLSLEDKARNAWYCERCADPEGYSQRLKKSQREARQRCLEAYPVCAACGRALPPEAIAAGRTRHTRPEVCDPYAG